MNRRASRYWAVFGVALVASACEGKGGEDGLEPSSSSAASGTDGSQNPYGVGATVVGSDTGSASATADSTTSSSGSPPSQGSPSGMPSAGATVTPRGGAGGEAGATEPGMPNGSVQEGNPPMPDDAIPGTGGAPTSAPDAGAAGAGVADAADSGSTPPPPTTDDEDDPLVVDPAEPLTAVAFYPSKDRSNTCADAAVSVQFNRPPIIHGGAKLEIHEASGAVFDSVTSNPRDELYFSDLVPRSVGGTNFDTDALDVVFNTVVFQPKAQLEFGKTYFVTIEEGMITDELGTPFSVEGADAWTFTVAAQEPAAADTYTLAADGSGDYCSLVGLLDRLPDESDSPRVVNVERGVYPGVVRMSDSNVQFAGAGIDQSVFSHKNSATMNSSREGIVVSGSDVTFANLTIFNTYLKDSNGQQAEALRVAEGSQRILLDNVHLRSHQDTLRVDGDSVYMRGGKISGSTDPLWGYGAFYCDGCELSSRTSGHAFVVARSTQGFALVNCRVTKDNDSVSNTSLAQYHDGSEPGKIAFVHCSIDDHIVGWKRPENNDWFEFGNTDLQTGDPVTFNAQQLDADSPELDALSSPENWLGWSP